jgi:hypothetical protein
MGYRKTENMYKNTEIIELFKECYAMEKIHGTSAHVKWQVDNSAPDGRLTFFSGGERHGKFVPLFDQEHLTKQFKQFGLHTQQQGITVYGEAYGGRCQGMKETYGDKLKFVAFEILFGTKEDGQWMSVHVAHEICTNLGLEFVHYERGPATLEWLNEQRDKDSTQAIRNGMGEGHMSEGVVVRPVIEVTKNGGGRFIVKHKRPEFRETRTQREVSMDPEDLKVLTEAREVAEEWVTEMRLSHVLDKLKADGVDVTTMQSTRQVINAMIEDVKVEGDREIEWSKEISTAVGRASAQLYKKRVAKIPV